MGYITTLCETQCISAGRYSKTKIQDTKLVAGPRTATFLTLTYVDAQLCVHVRGRYVRGRTWTYVDAR